MQIDIFRNGNPTPYLDHQVTVHIENNWVICAIIKFINFFKGAAENLASHNVLMTRERPSLQSMAELDAISRVQGKKWGVHGLHTDSLGRTKPL